MLISGLQKTSFIDYPEKIAAIVFTRGCNFRCRYCHNPELVDPGKYRPEIPVGEVLDFLAKRRDVLDGVVITGGEPTIQENLPKFIDQVKKLGLAVKLDTNGLNFAMLKSLVNQGKIDYVAMDIKHWPERYAEVTGLGPDGILKSVNFLLKGRLPYEFRTTVLPKFFQAADFHKIGQFIKGARIYYLQQFRPQKTLDPDLAAAESFTQLELEEFQKIMQQYVDRCEIRGII